MGDEGQELVLQAVELHQPPVLVAQREARVLRFGLCLMGQRQRLLQARGLLDQLLVADLDRSGDPAEDRHERSAEDEERDREKAGNRIERLPSLVGDSGVVVLVELEDADRSPAGRLDGEHTSRET